MGKVWRFFSSLRLALILILVLVGLSLIGTFVIQIPAGYKASLDSASWWLQNVAQPATGFWFSILDTLGLFDVFHSFWFLAAGSLLIISIIVCSVNRIKQTRASLAQGQLKIVGTYFIHLSLILFIAGFLTGSYMGFKNTSFVVPEGASKEIGNNTGLSLKLISFVDEYWPEGSPKSYRSDIELYQKSQVVKRGTVEVNHPVEYQGVRVYQFSFGPAPHIQIKDTTKDIILFSGNIALNQDMSDGMYYRHFGDFTISPYFIYFSSRALNINDPILAEGQIGMVVYKMGSNTPIASTKINLGVPYQVNNNFEITYLGDAKYSEFQVSKDPGNAMVWIASGLFVFGLIVVFYFPRLRVKNKKVCPESGSFPDGKAPAP